MTRRKSATVQQRPPVLLPGLRSEKASLEPLVARESVAQLQQLARPLEALARSPSCVSCLPAQSPDLQAHECAAPGLPCSGRLPRVCFVDPMSPGRTTQQKQIQQQLSSSSYLDSSS